MESLIAEGRSAYAKTRISPLASRVGLDAQLKSMEFVERGGLHADHAAIRGAIADFIEHRFINPSLEDYKAWRRSQGFTLTPIADMEKVHHVALTHELIFGSALPPGLSGEQIFDRFWSQGLRSGNGWWQIRSIAVDARGLQAVIGALTKGVDTREMIQGEWSKWLWHGATASSMRNWWTPRHPTDNLLKQFGSVMYAEVGIVTEFGDGTRGPLIITLIYDPIDKRWRMEHVNVNNVPPERVMQLEF